MKLSRWLAAFAFATVSFAILPEYGYPVVLQAEDVDNFWLGVIVAPLPGAATVLISGKLSGMLVCAASPLAGVVINEVYSARLEYTFEWGMVVVFYWLYYGILAMLGGAIVVSVSGAVQ